MGHEWVINGTVNDQGARLAGRNWQVATRASERRAR